MLLKKKKRLYDLEDIEPENQGGNYKQDYDLDIENAADLENVPFALLKAHAIAESSLNPRAFMDENPNKLSSRQGWASRGLMQLLFWPGSTRFEQFGYTSEMLSGGEKLYDPHINTLIAAKLIRANLKSCSGNLRDAVNMYNTGAKESVRIAPGGYVDKVLKYYNTLLGKV